MDLFVQAAGAEAPNKVVEIKTQQNNMLYILSIKTEKEKLSLISKASTISQNKDGLQKIYVNPDLTKTERNNQYLLRQEVRASQQHGEKVKISKGKVIQYTAKIHKMNKTGTNPKLINFLTYKTKT